MNFSRITAVAVMVFVCASVFAGEGSIKGSVKYNGEPPAPKVIKIAADKQADCKHEELPGEELVIDKATKGIKWAMVRVKDVKAPAPATPPAEASIDQKGCHFTPHVVIVAPGTNLNILNGDKVAHNFHTTPLDAENPGFNRMMTPADEKMVLKGEKYFATPEVIKMQCDIHPWMNGFILCHDPRFAAITDEKGNFEIKGIPAGKYEVVIFHELGEQTIKVEVKEGAAAETGDVLFPAKK